MPEEIKIPEIGENVRSGMVVGVLVKKGDMLEPDQAIIEIETDKAVVEIPSPVKGKLVELKVKVDEEVEVGQVIALIETVEGGEDAAKAETQEKKLEEPQKPQEAEKDDAVAEIKKSAAAVREIEEPVREIMAPTPRSSDKLAPASPSVRRLARELGADINEISGTGPGNRITDEDVKKYVKAVMLGKRRAAGKDFATPDLPDFSKWGEVRSEGFTKVRQLTAQNMGLAWHTVPHVTQFDEVDITAMEEFRRQYHQAVDDAGGKLTATAVIIKIIAAALQRFPRFNASIDMENERIIYKNYCNIGIAVDTDRGLLVPVIKNADKKSILELAVELTDLAERTRNKRVKPDELEGGTFTISNQGGIGGVNFTPIVYWPQVAILGVSRAAVRPRHVDGKFEPRTILPLALSYDHRANDGADAARFLRWVVEALEHPLLLNLES